ncbi:MAG: PhoH family protein [Gammaproteobacteria bacterium]
MIPKRPMALVELSLADNNRLANLCGAMDGNIARIARACSVNIDRRGGRFRVFGDRADVAADAIRFLYARAERDIAEFDVQMCLAEKIGGTSGEGESTTGIDGINGIGDIADIDGGGKTSRATLFLPRGENQKALLDKIRNNPITIATGPAGTGKTHLALVGALMALRSGTANRITLTRPAVEAAGEKLGFLPGDMESKVHPYLRPLHDILRQLLGRREAERRLQHNEIEVIPLAFMRGLTLARTITILDEAQNATVGQIKMLLTRLGRGGKMILTGDIGQSDLPPQVAQGLSDAMDRFGDIRGIAMHTFDDGDIVRHPLVRDILAAYDKRGKKSK